MVEPQEEQIPYESYDSFDTRPPINYPNIRNDGESTGIIKGLDFNNELKEIYLELSGYEYDFLNEQWTDKPIYQPIMNEKGVQNLINSLRSVCKKIITMSRYENEELIPRIKAFCKRNISHFIAYSEEYELDEINYNLISNYIFNFCDGAYHKALGGGDRNVVRGTYTEGIFAHGMGGGMNSPAPEKSKGWWSWLRGKR